MLPGMVHEYQTPFQITKRTGHKSLLTSNSEGKQQMWAQKTTVSEKLSLAHTSILEL